MKCIEIISQSPNAAPFRHLNIEIFDPFDTSEGDNDIIEYQGDIDPDRRYFNENSHHLFKNCNYYTTKTFNEYLLQNNISDNLFSG